MTNFSIASLASLPLQQRAKVIRSLSPVEALDLLHSWRVWARPQQIPPTGSWDNWLILAGRAFGKTRAGSEWVHEQAASGVKRIALVARTAADIRDVMVEGESGIIATAHPARRPRYEPSKRRLTWPNGCIATTFSAEEPDQLRGPQYERAWCDELAAWKYDEETWNQLQMVLRLGDHPQAVITTTPRPTPLVKRIVADTGTRVTRGSTFDNRANLPSAYFDRIVRNFEGTRLGRQELYAEILSDNPGALFKRVRIDELRVRVAPTLRRIVVAVDPAVSVRPASDRDESDAGRARRAETGIVIAGLGTDGHGYVLDDVSLSDTPARWASQVVAAYTRHKANLVIGEVNNGGDLVGANVATAAADSKLIVPYKDVRASRGKQTRAEPVAALYEQGRVHHVGAFPQLEDQLCDWDPSANQPSPDRLDALVWALTELMVGEGPGNTKVGVGGVTSRFGGGARGF